MSTGTAGTRRGTPSQRSAAAAASGRHRRGSVGILNQASLVLLVWLSLGLPALRATTILGPWVPIFKGIEHAVGTNLPSATGFPHLQVIHALRVDLGDPDIRLFSSPRIAGYVANSRETAGRTVSDFLRLNRLQAAINANDFNPQEYYLPAGTPMNIVGLSVSTGQVVSAQEGPNRSSAVVFTAQNQGQIIPTNWPAAPTDNIYTAVSGTYPLVIEGVNVGYTYLSSHDAIHQTQPRTAIGLSQDRRYLLLVAIDGRQPGYSEGALDYETAGWLLLLGAQDGVNMDGGGSTTMVVDDLAGNPVRLNRPSAVADSGRERTVGSHFGVFAKPLPGFVNDVTAAPDDTTATITWTTLAPSTSQVEYGLTTDLGDSTPRQLELVTNHAAVITGLSPSTGYYFRAVSTEGGTVHTSSNLFFMTTNYLVTNLVFDLTNAWRFTTANLDGVGWTAPSYDDATWDGPGPGLLWVDVRAGGPNPLVEPKNTQMPADSNNNGFPFTTYYLRTHFAYSNSLAGASLMFSSYVDDGALFYLNGAEIYRLHLPPAPAQISNTTLASAYSCDGDATCLEEFTVAGDLATNLVAGDNVLAVEVHNYNRLSPDITFGLSLSITLPDPPRPTMGISYSAGAITLSWTRAGCVVQSAPAPSGPWNDIAGTRAANTYRAEPVGAAQFYRLRK